MNWDSLRERVMNIGMRNSNTMAIAPTATISNICGVSQSIEPIYQNLFVKSNLSGEFTVVNPYLVDDLKQQGLWDDVMVNDLKYYDGSVQSIDRVPEELKAIYSTAFEVDSRWLVEAGSRRQKWIDQGQSLNLYMAEPSGKKLDNLYKLAWVRGLKTTYYLRSLGATAVEKSATQTPEPAIESEPKGLLDPRSGLRSMSITSTGIISRRTSMLNWDEPLTPQVSRPPEAAMDAPVPSVEPAVVTVERETTRETTREINVLTR